MPTGKLGAVAGSAWTRRLDVDVVMRSSIPYGISVRSLKPYRSARTAKKQRDAASIKAWRKRLRDAFRRYLVDCARGHPTATQLRKSVSEIVRLARRFTDVADRLLGALESDKNTETTLRRGLEIPGPEWLHFKRNLRDLYSGRMLSAQSSAAIVIRIAKADVDALVPRSGPWRDPALFRLVAVLVPLWKDITGRSARPVSMDRECERKAFPFAEWLEEMHRLIGFKAPPRGQILDSARPTGPRRRRKKTATRHRPERMR